MNPAGELGKLGEPVAKRTAQHGEDKLEDMETSRGHKAENAAQPQVKILFNRQGGTRTVRTKKVAGDEENVKRRPGASLQA